jgi:hypothetical protein
MPVRPRNPDNLARQVMPLLLFGVALTSSNRYFTLLENEALSVSAAAQPLGTVWSNFWTGSSNLHHPPLFEILMQLWIHATDGAFDYLRIPAVLFYIVGILFISLVARRMVGVPSALAVLWVGILWPFGFLHGRLAVSSTLSFFLVSALTLAYFRFLEEQSSNRWVIFFICAAALVWTSYWGWVILAFLAIDQSIRQRSGETTIDSTILIRTAGVLIVAFIPLWRDFLRMLRPAFTAHRPLGAMISNALFNLYVFFVGDAVAPWHWQLSILATVAALVAIGVVCLVVKGPVQRFLLYGGSLLVVMALMNGGSTAEQLPLVAPWILLPIGVALRAAQPNWSKFALPISLVLFAGTGWIGVYAMRNYATPQYLEPWPTVAQDAAEKIRGGATVVSNSPSFFLYLSYALQNPITDATKKLDGVLPDQIHDPRVQSPEQWLAAGHPIGPNMIWVHGSTASEPEKPIDDASHELDHACGARNSRLTTRDAGYSWKQKYIPSPINLEWRIEVREYDCIPDNGQIILTIPLR